MTSEGPALSDSPLAGKDQAPPTLSPLGFAGSMALFSSEAILLFIAIGATTALQRAAVFREPILAWFLAAAVWLLLPLMAFGWV